MANKITAVPNEAKNGFCIPSAYNKATLLDWLKKYKKFSIVPDEEDTFNGRRYLEGAVVPAYCKWQYGIDPLKVEYSSQRRFLFMRDFNFEIVKDKDKKPVKIPKSSKGRAKEILNKYTDWATENGAPIPNPDLFKLWRDKYKGDLRFASFYEFLDYLGIDCDAMPSEEVLEVLKVGETELEYPEEDIDLTKIPF